MENQKFYRVEIYLNSPYKWGDGYGKATSKEILMNESLLANCMQKIGFVVGRERDFMSPASYKSTEDDFQEIYLHPMEISGTMSIETVEKIKNFFNSLSDGDKKITNIDNVFIKREEKMYTQDEIVDILKKLSDDDIKKKIEIYQGVIPCNFDCSLIGINLKKFHFIKNETNSIIESQKDFIIKLLKEKIKQFK